VQILLRTRHRKFFFRKMLRRIVAFAVWTAPSRCASLDLQPIARKIDARSSFTTNENHTCGSTSLRRDYRRAPVPDRGHARQQPLARPTAPLAWCPDRNDAVLRANSGRSSKAADRLADARAPAAGALGIDGLENSLAGQSDRAGPRPMRRSKTAKRGSGRSRSKIGSAFNSLNDPERS